MVSLSNHRSALRQAQGERKYLPRKDNRKTLSFRYIKLCCLRGN